MHVDRVMSSLGRQQDTTMETELVLHWFGFQKKYKYSFCKKWNNFLQNLWDTVNCH